MNSFIEALITGYSLNFLMQRNAERVFKKEVEKQQTPVEKGVQKSKDK
ncbi:MAG: hypothetical protein AABY07_10965 [Nanoarchaeota archaeon]